MNKIFIPYIVFTFLIGCKDSHTKTQSTQTTSDSIFAIPLIPAAASATIQLTREEAQQKIMESLQYPKRRSSELIKSPSYDMNSRNGENQKMINQLYLLRDNGYVELIESSGTDQFGAFTRFQIKVTDKGRQFVMNESGEAYLLQTHSEVLRVTGISMQPESSSAVAEYVVEWEMTPFGNYFYYNLPQASSSPRQVVLRKFDDGWRVSN